MPGNADRHDVAHKRGAQSPRRLQPPPVGPPARLRRRRRAAGQPLQAAAGDRHELDQAHRRDQAKLRREVSAHPAGPAPRSRPHPPDQGFGAPLRHRSDPHDRRDRRRAHLQCRRRRQCPGLLRQGARLSRHQGSRLRLQGRERRCLRVAAAIRGLRQDLGQLRPVDLPRICLEQVVPRQDGRRRRLPARPLFQGVLPAALRGPDLRPRPDQSADGADGHRPRAPHQRIAAARSGPGAQGL